MDWQASLQSDLEQRHGAQLYRQRRLLESPQSAHIVVAGRECINFSSNDYLGLANHPRVVAAFTRAAQRYGVGSGASHLVCGHSTEHHLLEQELAQFTGRQRALLFSTGYMANLGTIVALLGKGDFIFEDKLNHASLIDAGQLCGARMHRFLHNDVAALERRLAACPQTAKKLIAVDGVFSMDGDCAPLQQLAATAAAHNAWLMVDDAHGFGVLGEQGGGVLQHCGLGRDHVPVLMATLGKALGSFGAFVAGSESLIETLIQQARTYIYTTALPPAVAAAARESLRLLQQEGWRRSHLQGLIARLRRGMAQLDLPLLPSDTAIQPLVLGDAAAALRASDTLLDAGLFVPAIRPPTVPAGTARLRIALSAAHSENDIDALLARLECLRP
jgi:8-amino-7-oxononanoate synthase